VHVKSYIWMGSRCPEGGAVLPLYIATVTCRPSAVDLVLCHDYPQGGSGRPTLLRDWSVSEALLYSDTVTGNALLVTLERQHLGDERPAGRRLVGKAKSMTRIVCIRCG